MTAFSDLNHPGIWLAKSQALINHQDFSESDLLASLSVSELQKCKRIKHPLRQTEFLASRFFIQLVLNKYSNVIGQISITDLYATDSGRLVLKGQKTLYLSLSHSQGYLTLAISSSAIGVDIEYCRSRRVSLEAAELFMYNDELAHFKQLSSEQQVQFFYQVWSAKEAYFKALADDQQGLFTSQDFSLLPYLTQQKESVTQTQDGNFWLLQPTQLQQLFGDKTAMILSAFIPADSRTSYETPKVSIWPEKHSAKKPSMVPLTIT